MKTCLYRMLGECKGCAINYDPNNRPNNYDCRKYHEVNLFTLEVVEKKEKAEGIDSIDKLLDKL